MNLEHKVLVNSDCGLMPIKEQSVREAHRGLSWFAPASLRAAHSSGLGTALRLCLGLVMGQAACWAAVPVMRIQPGPVETVVFRDERPVMKYRADPAAYKPYVSYLATPSGVNVLRDAPSDHLHHHGIMFGITVDGVDFWGEMNTQRPGREVLAGPIEAGGRGTILFNTCLLDHALRWIEKPGSPELLQEKRRIECFRIEEDNACTLLTWRSQFVVPANKSSATFSGQHYFGLGLRFVESMDGAAEFFYASPDVKTETVRGDERLASSAWCAFTSFVNGKPVTVAVFDHPTNPRRPATWFTMNKPFTYLSATMNLWKEPCIVGRPGTLDVVYGVAVWDGHASRERVDLAHHKWLLLINEYFAPPKAGAHPG
jgi:hypothetical protein